MQGKLAEGRAPHGRGVKEVCTGVGVGGCVCGPTGYMGPRGSWGTHEGSPSQTVYRRGLLCWEKVGWGRLFGVRDRAQSAMRKVFHFCCSYFFVCFIFIARNFKLL